MKHYSFGKIRQFKDVISSLNRIEQTPTIQFEGTVKLDGTQASIVKIGDIIYAQSKNRIITPDDDNYGFARFVQENIDIVKDMFDFEFSPSYYGDNTPTENDALVIYGEWCGEGIQSRTAVSKLSRRFVTFGKRAYTNGNEDGVRYFVLRGFSTDDKQIDCIMNYQKYSITIDFSRPLDFQNNLVALTLEVDKVCPYGKANGVEFTGEGIVWTSCDENYHYHFKTKGNTHKKQTGVFNITKESDSVIINGVEVSDDFSLLFKNLSNGNYKMNFVLD